MGSEAPVAAGKWHSSRELELVSKNYDTSVSSVYAEIDPSTSLMRLPFTARLHAS